MLVRVTPDADAKFQLSSPPERRKKMLFNKIAVKVKATRAWSGAHRELLLSEIEIEDLASAEALWISLSLRVRFSMDTNEVPGELEETSHDRAPCTQKNAFFRQFRGCLKRNARQRENDRE